MKGDINPSFLNTVLCLTIIEPIKFIIMATVTYVVINGVLTIKDWVKNPNA